MRLYIWEGNGISSAYHDDGTLVVLAESPEQAREVVRRARRDSEAQQERLAPLVSDVYQQERAEMAANGWTYSASFWQTPEGRSLMAKRDARIAALGAAEFIFHDGSDSALDREPDRVVDIDVPTVVAFNGGGYD